MASRKTHSAKSVKTAQPKKRQQQSLPKSAGYRPGGYETFVANHTKTRSAEAVNKKTAVKKETFGAGLIAIIICFMVYYLFFAFYLAQQGGDVHKKQLELGRAEAQAAELRATNEEYVRYLEGDSLGAYMEQKARDELHYAAPGERVYYVTPEQ